MTIRYELRVSNDILWARSTGRYFPLCVWNPPCSAVAEAPSDEGAVSEADWGREMDKYDYPSVRNQRFLTAPLTRGAFGRSRFDIAEKSPK